MLRCLDANFHLKNKQNDFCNSSLGMLCTESMIDTLFLDGSLAFLEIGKCITFSLCIFENRMLSLLYHKCLICPVAEIL